MNRSFALTGVTTLLSVAGACVDNSHDHPTSYSCEAESRADDFVVGIEKPGSSGQLTFKLTAASPAPPSRGDNTWTLQLTNGGALLEAADIRVTPFMPDHLHGTPIGVGVVPASTAGEYTLTPVNLFMPGLWEILIDAAPSPGESPDRAVFRFCIAS